MEKNFLVSRERSGKGRVERKKDGEGWRRCGVAARLEGNSLDNLVWRFASRGQSIQLI